MQNEFEDLLQIYAEDKGEGALPARIAINALASFEHADTVTADLDAGQSRRVAAAQATQSPKGGHPGMLPDAERVSYPPASPRSTAQARITRPARFPMGTARRGSGSGAGQGSRHRAHKGQEQAGPQY